MDLPCPHDTQPLVIQDVDGHIGHRCDACHGAWLPRKYLQTIEHGRRFSEADLQSTFAAQMKRPTSLSCPSGCGILNGVYIKGIELDWCPQCMGIWFDRGEIAKLMARFPALSASKSESADVLDLADVACGLFDLFS